eukprot:CAMPEP_0206160266 /NCGR_PEP_ID=MMETSP1474-20131121/6615_1 /ASSEMBLY_ACC=CAM_ASM_001110 /TAXON_ID=97495 /ORGANISM="Imantonia sp., Strain RCC918" /LENGTH=402 /DNA_ID=CAMNT_0053561513 /DNA_START=294 /DNA_END=1502 /DNA_ORIENTATION=-
MFSSSGYEALGIPKKKHPKDTIWKKGMKFQGFSKVDIAKFLGFDIPVPLRNPLRDPPVDTWEDTFKQDIHVLILLASSDEEALIDTVIEIQNDIEQFGLHVIGIEDGKVIRNDKNQVIEHFGHPDGVSQPLFYTSDYDTFLKQQNIFNDKKQLAKYGDPKAPLNLVLTKDPLGNGDYSFGSYMVYRKLEQDIIGYKTKVKELAEAIGVEEKLADQMVIGRDTDGIPLGNLRTEPADGIVPDNFDFSHKPSDSLKVCPFQAHIRKANPRTSESILGILHDGVPQQRIRRIARRAVSFGPDIKALEENDCKDSVGLLFLCANADLGLQFVFMQTIWMNNPHFQKLNVGQDTILGQHIGDDKPPEQKWIDSKGNEKKFLFNDVVHMKGGEYFFMPSMHMLQNLAA